MPTAAASVQDAPHPLVGRERLALDDPDRGQLARQLDLRAAGRLLLHQLVQELVEADVVRRDRVERLPARLDEHRLGNLGRRVAPHLAFQQRGDARAEAALRVGVDLRRALDQLDGRSGVHARVLVDERAAEHERPRRARVPDVVAAVGQRPVIARPDEQEPAALAAIRARQPEVDDPAPPHVVEDPERLRRRLDDHRPRRQIDDADEVHRVGVRGQEQRLRPQQLREHQDLVVLRPRLLEALAQRVRRRSREAVEEHVQGVREVEVVIHELAGLGLGKPST